MILNYFQMKYSNNPFNIRATKSNWLGLTGSVNGFCTFESVSYSVRVFLILALKTYVRRFGNDYTLEQFVNTFCPVGDGNNNPTVYLNFVLSFMRDRHFLVQPCSCPAKFYKDCLFVFASAVCRIESNYVLNWNDFLNGYKLFKS